MKPSFNRFLAASVTSVIALSSSAFAATRIKQNNTTALNLAGSWDILPTSSDIVQWDSTVLGANSTALGADLSWSGIKINSPGGAVTATYAAGQTLTLGTDGIDMSVATQNLSLLTGGGNTAGTLAIGAAQTWNVASGRTLTLFSTSNSANQRLSGSGNIQVSGGGTVAMNVGDLGSTTFASGNGNDTYTGNWTISGGSKVISLRNGTHAWGNGSITLDNGTISQNSGNWSWSNNIAIGAGGGTIFSDSSGNARYLDLAGIISGANTLTFNAIAAMTTQEGFILTGANTFSGTMVINANGTVRIGGDATTGTNSTAAGTLGSINPSMGITNNGILGFGRTDAHTVSNVITGAGVVRLGRTGGVLPASQVLTLSGASNYTGATQVNAGRLNLTGSLTSPITVAAGKIGGSGSTTGLLTMNTGSSLVLAGGATTTGLTVNGATFNAPTIATFDTAPTPSMVYDVYTYGTGPLISPSNLTVGWRGVLSDDVPNKKYIFTAGASGTRTWNTTNGTWNQALDANFAEGDMLFYGGDTVIFNNPAADSIVTLVGQLAPASVSVTNTNAYTFSGTGSMAGAMTLTKAGPGTLTLGTANTYTGATMINGGTVVLANAAALGNSSAVTVASGATLDLAGNSASSPVTLAGSGVSGLAALYNSTASAPSINGGITLAANATLGGLVNNNKDQGINYAVGLDLGGFTLSLTSGRLLVNNTDTLNNGNIAVNSGSVLFLTGNSAGSGNAAISVNAGGTLDVRDYNNSALTSFPVLTLNGGSIGNALLGSNGGGSQSNIFNPIVVDPTLGGSIVGANTAFNLFLRLSGTLTGSGPLTLAGAKGVEFQGDTSGYTGTATATEGTISFNPAAAQTFNGKIAGTRPVSKTGAGTTTLTGINTYTGNTTVSAGALTLADNAQLKFVIGANGVNNGITGGATLLLNGDFNLDLSGADTTNGNTWNLVNVATLTETFGVTFTLIGFTESADVHTMVVGPLTWTFTEATGDLTVAPTDYNTWLALYTFAPGANKTPTGDPDGDGLTNRQEYAFGLDPSSGASVNPITAQLDKTAGTLTYTRRKPSLTGLTYRIWTSPDLAIWTVDSTAGQVPTDVGDNQSVAVTLTGAPLTASKLFVRVTAE